MENSLERTILHVVLVIMFMFVVLLYISDNTSPHITEVSSNTEGGIPATLELIPTNSWDEITIRITTSYVSIKCNDKYPEGSYVVIYNIEKEVRIPVDTKCIEEDKVIYTFTIPESLLTELGTSDIGELELVSIVPTHPYAEYLDWS